MAFTGKASLGRRRSEVVAGLHGPRGIQAGLQSLAVPVVSRPGPLHSHSRDLSRVASFPLSIRTSTMGQDACKGNATALRMPLVTGDFKHTEKQAE